METEAAHPIFEFQRTTASYIGDGNSAGSGETTAEPHGEGFRQGAFAIFAWSIIYGVVIVVGLLGNTGICWIVFSTKRMRTVTNYFLANTAFADALIVIFNTVFNFIYAINGEWYFGKWFCHFINFLPVASVSVSILSIAVISLDRFIVIMYPLRKRISKKQAMVVLAILWVVSLGISFPQAYFATHGFEKVVSGTRYLCSVVWPGGIFGSAHMRYQITFMSVSYFVPLLVLAISYFIVAKKLWGARASAVGDMNYSHRKKLKSNRKAVKMMMFVVFSFAICWLPYQTYFIVGFTHPNMIYWSGIQQVYLAVFWLAMSSTVYNPFIYCWNNRRFRNEFKKLLLLKCKCFNDGRAQPTTYSRTYTKTGSLMQKTEVTMACANNFETSCM